MVHCNILHSVEWVKRTFQHGETFPIYRSTALRTFLSYKDPYLHVQLYVSKDGEAKLTFHSSLIINNMRDIS